MQGSKKRILSFIYLLGKLGVMFLLYCCLPFNLMSQVTILSAYSSYSYSYSEESYLGLLVSPKGDLSYKIKEYNPLSDTIVNLGTREYETEYSIGVFFEYRKAHTSLRCELEYSKFLLRKKIGAFNTDEGLYKYTLAFLYGYDFNDIDRTFQFPIYLGIGGNYLNGEPFNTIDNFLVSAILKIEPSLSISDRFKIFISGNYIVSATISSFKQNANNLNYKSYPTHYQICGGIKFKI